MKKITLLLVVLLVALTSGYSQSQRLVLFEEFTNASCSPCASQNPAFDALLAANPTKCTSIKYHTNWPGVDPMNAQNPGDVSTRVGYYGVNGVPMCFMDGVAPSGTNYLGAPANVNQAKIDAEYAIASPFELIVNQQLSPGNDSLYVTILGTATASVSGSLVLHIAVIEKHIHFNTAPGSNGEKDFYNVMKKMLPGASGTALPTSITTGDYFIVKYAWKLANVYSLGQLSVVAFIQDNATKTVHQAANTTSTPILWPYANDVMLSSISNVMPGYCEPRLAPSVTIRNYGTQPLTSVNIHCKVNDGAPNTYHWTGNLGFLQTTTINLPSYDFELAENNTLTIYADGTSGSGGNYTGNDTLIQSFPVAKQSEETIKVFVRTDTKPQETTWEIKDLNGNVLSSGGPYTQASHLYSQTITVGLGTCYTFYIYDSGGDGLASPGFYIVNSGSATIGNGGVFTTMDRFQFYSPSGVNVPVREQNALELQVYPNPVSNEATLSFVLQKTQKIAIEVIDLQGRIVLSVPERSYDAGLQTSALDFSKLQSGIYSLQLESGTVLSSCKVTVVR